MGWVVELMALGNNTNASFFVFVGYWMVFGRLLAFFDANVRSVVCSWRVVMLMALVTNTNAFFFYFF